MSWSIFGQSYFLKRLDRFREKSQTRPKFQNSQNFYPRCHFLRNLRLAPPWRRMTLQSTRICSASHLKRCIQYKKWKCIAFRVTFFISRHFIDYFWVSSIFCNFIIFRVARIIQKHVFTCSRHPRSIRKSSGTKSGNIIFFIILGQNFTHMINILVPTETDL